jgi:low affinity Fe/Cu permease
MDLALLESMFRRFAHATAEVVGTWWAFTIAVAVVLGWAATGPVFGFSNTWQLVINTATTIVTFLMVFLIQNTQNRARRRSTSSLTSSFAGSRKRARAWSTSRT